MGGAEWDFFFPLIEPAHLFQPSTPPKVEISTSEDVHDITFKLTQTFDCLKADLQLFKHATIGRIMIYEEVKGQWGCVCKMTDTRPIQINILDLKAEFHFFHLHNTLVLKNKKKRSDLLLLYFEIVPIKPLSIKKNPA